MDTSSTPRHPCRARWPLLVGLATIGVTLLTILPGVQLGAQESRSQSPDYAVTVGFGNVLGWLGGGFEKYVSAGRGSVAVGLGYVPETSEGNPGFTAFGAGVRRYLGSGAHKASLELSLSLVSFEWISQGGVVLESNKYYGPGLSLGYRYTADGGFHFDASLGPGWAVGDNSIHTVGSLAVGYTWRR